MTNDTGDVRLDADTLAQFSSPDAKALLDTIDQLRELQVGSIISLPQIIVVGDQSSGKSSVLESISRVRFPVDGGVCTRFATELVLRRASEVHVDVSIQFADSTAALSGQEDKDRQQQPFKRSGFGTDSLADIISEAREHMGLGKGDRKGFSKDVLRVEISGPEMYPLTLVDLPGCFHSTTAYQSQEDKELVDELLDSYMRQKKSIILNVIAANNQLACQVVLRKARKHDPKRERTLGVVTKPDLIGSTADRREYINLIQGLDSQNRLGLGWCVLRNQSEDERVTGSFDERDASEARFFAASTGSGAGSSWSSVRSSAGVDCLRKKLSRVLLDHIRTNLPGLVRDIETSLTARRAALEKLGEQRSTPRELRSYLFEIADKFNKLADDGLQGRYGDSFFGRMEDEDRKLRALIRNLNRVFCSVLQARGSTYQLEQDQKQGDDKVDKESTDEYLQRFIDLYSQFPSPSLMTESALNGTLELYASRNQGKEFPCVPNSNLAFQLFAHQAQPWEEIARFHISLVLVYARSFVERIFEHIIGTDSATIAAILRHCVGPFFEEKQQELEAKLAEILWPFFHEQTLPLESEFRERFSRRRLHHLADHLMGDDQPMLYRLGKDGIIRKLSREQMIQALDTETGRRSHLGTSDVVDMMLTHYELSLKTFIDNVINLAVEGRLVRDITSILTTRKVNRMEDEQLREIAAESEDVQTERASLQEEILLLQEALNRCNRHRPVALTVTPAIASLTLQPRLEPAAMKTPKLASAKAQPPVSKPQQAPTMSPLPAPEATKPPIFPIFGASAPTASISTPSKTAQAPKPPSFLSSPSVTPTPKAHSVASGGSGSIFSSTSSGTAATAAGTSSNLGLSSGSSNSSSSSSSSSNGGTPEIEPSGPPVFATAALSATPWSNKLTTSSNTAVPTFNFSPRPTAVPANYDSDEEL